MRRKNKALRQAQIKTVLFFILLAAALIAVLFWASKTPDSELAQSIRQIVGISEPSTRRPPPPQPMPVAPLVVETPPAPEPAPVIEPEPVPLPEMSWREFCSQRGRWPQTLHLKSSKRVYIRYNGNVYGHMQFSAGMPVAVDALSTSGEVFGRINGNHLNFSIEETDFEDWFHSTYGDRYQFLPIEVEGARSGISARHRVGTPEGDAVFWSEMRIWCDRNYGSIALEIAEDSLVFRWLPQEETPIDFALEAREIARNFLMKRGALGSNENYAACEIRHPVSGELLGASSIFIPRL